MQLAQLISSQTHSLENVESSQLAVSRILAVQKITVGKIFRLLPILVKLNQSKMLTVVGQKQYVLSVRMLREVVSHKITGQ